LVSNTHNNYERLALLFRSHCFGVDPYVYWFNNELGDCGNLSFCVVRSWFASFGISHNFLRRFILSHDGVNMWTSLAFFFIAMIIYFVCELFIQLDVQNPPDDDWKDEKDDTLDN
jgi:hypothetical protein